MKAPSIVVCSLLLLLLAEAQITMAVNCKPTELSSCANSIVSSTPPSGLCCTKIKEQKPCLCQYLKNPSLKKFVNSPNARKVASTCGTPFPKC
ncbi:AAI domain-containing protein [Psidium guajava]|nr:AAI domain-containing protein [Psidium guajava]